MKKAIVIISALAIISFSAGAQAYASGDNLVNVGVGIGSPFFSSGFTANIPVNPTISYEKGISDAISVGGLLSYASSKYNFSGVGYNFSFKESATFVGARGSYHFGSAINLGDKADIYAGLSLGYVIATVTDNSGGGSGTASGVGYAVFAGGKYYFSPAVGVYAELGYTSLSILNIGLAFKF